MIGKYLMDTTSDKTDTVKNYIEGLFYSW
jgi:hypothetical protein